MGDPLYQGFRNERCLICRGEEQYPLRSELGRSHAAAFDVSFPVGQPLKLGWSVSLYFHARSEPSEYYPLKLALANGAYAPRKSVPAINIHSVRGLLAWWNEKYTCIFGSVREHTDRTPALNEIDHELAVDRFIVFGTADGEQLFVPGLPLVHLVTSFTDFGG